MMPSKMVNQTHHGDAAGFFLQTHWTSFNIYRNTTMRRFLVCALLLVTAGASAQTAPSVLDAVAVVARFGGTVEYVSGDPLLPIRKIDLSKTAVTDADLTSLRALVDLEILDLRLTKITDAGIAHLGSLRSLKQLNLFRTQVTDAALAQLQNLENLETLLIGGTQVSDRGMALLTPLKSLKKISIFDTQVGDEGVVSLARMSSLRVLLLDRSKVSAQGRAKIQEAIPGISFSESIT